MLEVKGQSSEEELAKRQSLDEWVEAVNAHRGFGEWCWAVSRAPQDVVEILRDLEKLSVSSSVMGMRSLHD